MSTKPRPKTLNRGAADARALCKRAMTATLNEWKTSGHFAAVASFAQEVRGRIDAMAKNASNRPGGMGRK